jgi:threonyl-tRNA synthetase
MAKVSFETEAVKKAFWHSTSHILADAVKRLWPDVKLGIGPAIEEGFYYDFDKRDPFTEKDLAKIEKEMQKIIKANLKFEQIFLPRKEAEKFLAKEPYKLDLLKEIPDKQISFYKHGKFQDLCKGPLIKSTGQIGAFKLLNTAAAYWRGDPKKPVLQRIYGISFPTQKELDAFLKKREEAEARDHVKIGRQLDLFNVYSETVGPGLPIWHPKGAIIRNIIQDFWRAEHAKRGYQYVFTPHLGNVQLWKTSGHWVFYKDNMYPPMKVDNIDYLLKPMSCPFHVQIYKFRPRSYKELPIRYCELATVYRPELGGALHGLVRVRSITQDDAHIFCSLDQLETEIKSVLEFGLWMLEQFGFKNYIVELSLRDPKNKTKYLGSDEIWAMAERALTSVLEKRKLKYTPMLGEAAFYGPKIDVHLLDALGRKWQCLTIQVDFNFPEKFDLNYTGQDGKEHRIVLLHRTLLGAIERFTGILIEHYAGAFPVWLAPIQVKLLSFTDRNIPHAKKVEQQLREAGLRVETDYENNTVDYKVRQAEMEKVPYIIVIGDKEEKANTLAVRPRGQKPKFGVKIEDFIKQIKEEIEKKI